MQEVDQSYRSDTGHTGVRLIMGSETGHTGVRLIMGE